jgi:hypothetical protein
VLDSEYFRTALQADVDAAGGSAVVAVHLVGGRTHRLRSVVAVHAGYVTAEAYQSRGDAPVREPRWREESAGGAPTHPTERTVIAYESIADVTITPARPDAAGAIGFGRA